MAEKSVSKPDWPIDQLPLLCEFLIHTAIFRGLSGANKAAPKVRIAPYVLHKNGCSN